MNLSLCNYKPERHRSTDEYGILRKIALLAKYNKLSSDPRA